MQTTHVQAGDTVLAFALVVVGFVGTAAASANMPAAQPIDPFGYALAVAAAAALVVRRRWPLATLLLVAALSTIYLVVGYAYGPILFAFFVAAYTAARHREVRQALPVALIALAILMTHLVFNDTALPGWWGVLPAAAWVAVPFAVGISVKANRDARARERDEALRKRIDDERLRVAEEVHDIVGHGLAAIRMQADVALHVLPKRPQQAAVALEAISRTSGEALDELRATLGAVREAGPGASSPPEPRLARLDHLQRRMSDAGARIDVQAHGTARPLPPAVDLAGYRIVQESLTNVLRHGATKAARVSIDYRPDDVVITIVSPAADGAGAGDGHGIEGMRRRVVALGGDFTAGPTDDHHFQVRATIPTDGPS